MKGYITASGYLAENLTESYKALETAHVEVEYLKEQVVRADTEKVDSEKIVIEDGAESVQHKVHLKIGMFGRNRAEKVVRLLVTEPVNSVDAVAQPFAQEAVD